MTAAVVACCCVLAAADAGVPGAPIAANADVRAALSPEARAAFDQLLRTRIFASANVGESGERSENAAAVQTLIRERAAPAAFQALYDSGSPIAALYALTAFWYLRPTEFLAYVRQVHERYGERKIDTLQGCIRSRELVGDLLESKRGGVRLASGTGLYRWSCGKRKGSKFFFDFASGTFPITIVEGGTIENRLCAHPPPLPEYLKPRR